MDSYEEYLLYIRAAERRQRRRATLIPLVLMVATIFTTLFAGALMQFVKPSEIFHHPANLLRGAYFAMPLMIILFTHEMGHFIASKVHRVKASLPYFIPFPNFIGTMGAVIMMKSQMRDRRALLDIGAAGPLAGFVLSLAACVWGVQHLEAVPLSSIPSWSFLTPRISFGNNLTMLVLYRLLNIKLLPGFVYMNPILDAGWLGMFVTSLNLLPAGQLDGGHISYALLGEKGARRLARVVVIFLLMLGLPAWIFGAKEIIGQSGQAIPGVFWAGWAIWGLLITVLGIRHPPPMDPYLELDRRRKIIGLICLIVFILTFTPMPFQEF